MKTLVNKTRIAVVALIALFTVAFNSPALANGGKEKNAIPVELKYVGQLNDQPLFELAFANEEETEYTVVIRDEFGTILYKDALKGSTFSKKFLLNTEDLGNTSVKFEVIGKKTDKTATFEVNRNSRTIEDHVISKN